MRISYSLAEWFLSVIAGVAFPLIGGWILARWHGVLVMTLIVVQMMILGWLVGDGRIKLLRWRMKRDPSSPFALPPEINPLCCSVCGREGRDDSLTLCDDHSFMVQDYCESLRHGAFPAPAQKEP